MNRTILFCAAMMFLFLSADAAPLLAADTTAMQAAVIFPTFRFFGAFLGMVVGGLITTKMPPTIVKKEPHVFLGLGAFFGFVLAEALIGFLFLILCGSCFYALHRSWGDIEPVVHDVCARLRGEAPVLLSGPVADRSADYRDERFLRDRERERREAAAYSQIVADVEEQARRFHYPEELKQREIEHRFRKWSEQQCQN